MSIDKIIVAVIGIAGIIFTYWFFLMKREEVVSVTDAVDITVKGGYNPNTISITKGKTTKIRFTRTDPSSCLEEVVISDFKVKKFLPLNETVEIEVNPKEAGEYNFACGMNMFHGKIIVK